MEIDWELLKISFVFIILYNFMVLKYFLFFYKSIQGFFFFFPHNIRVILGKVTTSCSGSGGVFLKQQKEKII